jgi:hypothetical protein
MTYNLVLFLMLNKFQIQKCMAERYFTQQLPLSLGSSCGMDEDHCKRSQFILEMFSSNRWTAGRLNGSMNVAKSRTFLRHGAYA